MKHRFLVTLNSTAQRKFAANYIRKAVVFAETVAGAFAYQDDETAAETGRDLAKQAKEFLVNLSGVSVRSVKGWNGTHKPAKVSVRRLKNGRVQVYASGKPLGSDFPHVNDARKFLRSRHPSLAKSADYSRA